MSSNNLINITNLDINTLYKIISQFPSGKVIAKGNIAFWDYGDDYSHIEVPQNRQSYTVPPSNQVKRPIQPQNRKKNTFFNMFDSMASHF